MEQQTFDPSIQIHSHIGADGTLHLEGLDDMAGLDVVITLLPDSNGDNVGTLNTMLLQR